MPRWISLALLCLIATSALAVDPRRRISQYGHAAWRIRDGVFSSAPHSVTQTADGYLWIGTEAGLIRFDGVRFVPWKTSAGPQFDSRIFHILGTRDGSLWLAAGNALTRIRNGRVALQLETGRLGVLREDPAGDGIWIVRSRRQDDRGPLCHVSDRGMQCYGESAGISWKTGVQMAIAPDRSVWLGGVAGLMRWAAPAHATRHFELELDDNQGLFGLNAIAASADGTMWASIEAPGAPAALRAFQGGAWTTYPLPGSDVETITVHSLFVDRDGAVWIGTMSHGIYRFHQGTFDHFGMADGLSGNGAGAFHQDHEGNLWVATTQGLDVFRDAPVVSYSVREGLSADSVSSAVAASDGRVWIGNVGSLDVLHDGKVSGIRKRDGLPGQTITALFADRANRIWTGVDEELFVREGAKFRRIVRPDGAAIGFVTVMTEDVEGNLWARTPEHFYRIRDLRVEQILDVPAQMPEAYTLTADPRGGIWLGWSGGKMARYHNGRLEHLHPPPGSRQSAVLGIVADADGSVWAAIKRGLLRIVGKERRLLSMRNGLPCEGYFGMERDDRGSLWLYGQCGIVGIARSELQRWWANPDVVVKVTLLSSLDGAQPGMATFQPSATKTPDRRLWFANDRVVQMIDPARLGGNRQPPAVHIEQVVADRRVHPAQKNLRLPALTRDLQIDYTALSFVQPQKVRFRYKLEPRDRDWQDPQTRRQAFYSDLPPGHYTFQVIACNDDGVWNEAGAKLQFEIAAAWYQTNWFRVLVILTALLLAWLLYRLRMRQVARNIGARFDERLAERTRIARELHDTLLQTIQASKMIADDALAQPHAGLSAEAGVEPRDPVRLQRGMERLSDWLGRAVAEGRAAVNSLRTSVTEENDLARALRVAAEHCGKPDSMAFSLDVTGSPRNLHPIVRDEIYRIGYEAIRNACTHSHATRIDVDLRYEKNITLRIQDDGVGIAPEIVERGKEGHFVIGRHARARRPHWRDVHNDELARQRDRDRDRDSASMMGLVRAGN